MTVSVPNLDAMDEASLTAFIYEARILVAYAECKRHSVSLRLAGDVERALYYDERCDELYKRLPEWARTW